MIQLELYFCGTRIPQPNKDWLRSWCSLVGQNPDPTVANPVASKTYVRYAPGPSQPGVRLTGYHMGHGSWSVTAPHNGQSQYGFYEDYSQGAYAAWRLLDVRNQDPAAW